MNAPQKPTRVIDAEFVHTSSGPDPRAALNPLARLPERSVNPVNPLGKGDSLGQAMLDAVRNVRESDGAYVHRDRDWWARLTGKMSARDKRIGQHDLAQTGQVCTFLEKNLALECDALYERCREDANLWLARHRIAARGDLIEFATNELQRLKDTVEERRQQFTRYIRLRTQRLQANADLELLVEAEVADMKMELEQHLAFLRELEELFRAAVRDRVG